MKRIISFIGVTLLTAMPLFANIAEGVSGDCTWVIDDDGNLIVSSEADNAVLGTWEGDAAPWSKYKESITTVSFTSPVDAQTCTYMFSGCTNLNAIYLDNFYTNKVTDMSYMFANCKSLEVIEFGMTINPLDEDVLFAKGMFSNRDNFLTSNVKNMAGMFEGCESLAAFKLQNLDVHSVMDFTDMFAGCSSMKNMDLTGLQVNRNAKVANMFADCNKLMYLSNESVFPTEVEDATFMSLPTRGTCKVDLPFDSLEDYENAKGWRYLFIANAENETKLLGQQTTSISNMASVDEDEKTVFSFAGERLSAPVKGLNIIAGKKVMMK